MTEILKELCELDGASGDESKISQYIIKKINGHCEYKIDPIGNILVFKKGKKSSTVKLMLDAHTDEVGLIITSITPEGFLRFKKLGGIDTAVILSRRVKINGNLNGVIGGKPIHLMKSEESKVLPDSDNLYIDIGAVSMEDALSKVSLGDYAVISGDYTELGDKIMSKAIDDRAGCAILIKLLTEESEYDFHASFSVQEELGLRGAGVSTYTINPQAAIVLEATTAADIADVQESKQVCVLGNGAAVSFMDNSTVYDRKFYNAALKSCIKCQPKSAVAGGNNSGAVHLSREGVRTIAISVPCRYIHSASCVADKKDIYSSYELAKYMLEKICSGFLND